MWRFTVIDAPADAYYLLNAQEVWAAMTAFEKKV